MAKTGEKNISFGVYQNCCCDFEIVISVGAEFPTCPRHPNRNTEWTKLEVEIAEVVVKRKSRSESAA